MGELKKLRKPINSDLTTLQDLYDRRISMWREHMPKSYDLVLLTLKGHLLAEEILDQIISKSCKEPEAYLDLDIGFSKKISLCRALHGELFLDVLIPMLKTFNALRNELAHNLNTDKLERKIVLFIDSTYVRRAKGEEISLNDNDLAKKLRLSIDYLLGFLSAVEGIIVTGVIPPKVSLDGLQRK